jgi:hypothetical protein
MQNVSPVGLKNRKSYIFYLKTVGEIKIMKLRPAADFRNLQLFNCGSVTFERGNRIKALLSAQIFNVLALHNHLPGADYCSGRAENNRCHPEAAGRSRDLKRCFLHSTDYRTLFA